MTTYFLILNLPEGLVKPVVEDDASVEYDVVVDDNVVDGVLDEVVDVS